MTNESSRKPEKKERHIKIGDRYFFLPAEAAFVPEIFDDIARDIGKKVVYLNDAPEYTMPDENNSEIIVTKAEYDAYQTQLNEQKTKEAEKKDDQLYDSRVSKAITAAAPMPKQINMMAALISMSADEKTKAESAAVAKSWSDWIANIKKAAKRHKGKDTPFEHIDWPALPDNVQKFIVSV